jgi:hypothetical protein
MPGRPGRPGRPGKKRITACSKADEKFDARIILLFGQVMGARERGRGLQARLIP